MAVSVQTRHFSIDVWPREDKTYQQRGIFVFQYHVSCLLSVDLADIFRPQEVLILVVPFHHRFCSRSIEGVRGIGGISIFYVAEIRYMLDGRQMGHTKVLGRQFVAVSLEGIVDQGSLRICG